MIDTTGSTLNARAARRLVLALLTGALGTGCAAEERTHVAARPVARAAPADVASLAAGTVTDVPPSLVGRRAVALVPAADSPSDLRLLVGGDGVRFAGEPDPAAGRPSRVVPVVLAEGVIGHIWRARADRPDATLPVLPNHADVPDTASPHALVYLDATPLGPRAVLTVVLDGGTEWALVEPAAAGPIRLSSEPAVDALLFAEIDADTWTRVDHTPVAPGGTGELHAAGDRATALVVHRRLGGGVVTIHAGVGSRRAGDGPLWRLLLADDGEPDSHWGMISSPAHELGKRLTLDVDPETLRGARIVYCMGAGAYDQEMRVHAPAPGAGWSHLIVTVNGEGVARRSLGEWGTRGWHRIEIPPAVLRRGENRVTFRVDGDDYAYLAVDTDTAEGRSGVVTNGRIDPTTLRPGRTVSGEYLVRLEVR